MTDDKARIAHLERLLEKCAEILVSPNNKDNKRFVTTAVGCGCCGNGEFYNAESSVAALIAHLETLP